MKKLIKANLCDILRLVPIYLPVAEKRSDQIIDELQQGEFTDYLFLARREKAFLFDIHAVYTPDSYANLSWTYYAPQSHIPAHALLLHVVQAQCGNMTGHVSLLNYPEMVQDVEHFSALPEPIREKHISHILRHSARKARYCTVLEVIQYFKTGRS